MRRKYVYQFLVLLLQYICGGLVVTKNYSMIAEFAAIILPCAFVGAVLFRLYEREIIKEFNNECHK